MKISVDKDRKVYTSSSLAGTVNENYYEVLEFTFPEELENYTKYIEIQAEDLRYVDRIEDNKFTISNELTKYEYLQVQIVCKDLQNNIVFKSNIFTLSTNESLNIMEDISEEQGDLLDRIELELQEAKEDITDLQETQEQHTEQIQTNATDIATLQGQVATNETDIANIKTKNTQQDNAIATNTQDITDIKVEQTTQNTNISKNASDIADIQAEQVTQNTNIANKVDKVTGKGLSTEDYTTDEKNKLANLENYDDTEVKADIQENTDDIEALTNKHNTEVAELQSQIEDLQAENQALEDQIPTGDASGSDITLSDSARYYFKKIVPGGKSEQETTDGRQLFDGNNPSGVNMATSKLENDILTISSESTETIPFVRFFENYEVSPNDIIRLNVIILDANGQIVVQEYINSQWLTISSLTRNYIDGKTISEISRTISENATAIRFLFYSNNSKPTQSTSSRYKNIIVTKNNSNMEYERYTGGQPAPNPDYECPIQNVTGNVEVKVENKNKFDGELELGQYDSNTGQKLSNNNLYRNKNIIKVKPLTTYTFSINGVSQAYVLLEYKSNKEYIGQTVLDSGTFTTNSNTGFINFRCKSNDFTSDYANLKVQLEEGLTATEYIEHEEQTAIFPLEEGQVLHETDTIEDKIVQKRGTRVLNGSENWQSSGGGDNTYRFSLTMSEFASGKSGYCNRNKWVTSGVSSDEQLVGIISSTLYFRINKGIISSLEGSGNLAKFKTWLATNNVIIETELIEPLEIPFTEAQRTAKAQIDKLYSYKGTTHISSTNEPSPIFEVQYYMEGE